MLEISTAKTSGSKFRLFRPPSSTGIDRIGPTSTIYIFENVSEFGQFGLDVM
jgi:hypothetical protein